MYTPGPFRESRRATLLQFIERFSFATLISTTDAGLFVSHVPLLLDRRGPGEEVLSGHVAKANEHSALLAAAAPTLAIFHGPHAYISPSWLSSDLSVPTWNYAVVHVRGTPTVVGPEETRRIVEQLTKLHERNAESPWAPEVRAESLERLLGSIVGFRIEVSSIEGKFKLSQNKSQQDRDSVVAGLAAQGSASSSHLAEFAREYFARSDDQ